MGTSAEQNVQAGQPAPDFALQDEEGKAVRLSDFRGKRVVLFMYPRDNTPGCTAEACDFRDNMERIRQCGAVVLGLSTDNADSHQKFKKKHNLPFPLLVDDDAETAKAYGAWVQKNMFGRKFWGIERSTFIIDEQGELVRIFRKVRVKGHVDEVIDVLNAL